MSLIAGSVAVAAIAALSACGGDDVTADTNPTATSTTTSTAAPTTTTAGAKPASATTREEANTALAALGTLPVKGRAPKTGYGQELFGSAWTDDVSVDGGHNGCDTRNDILRRDLTHITVKPGSNNCTVVTGTLNDAYTGTEIAFTRGEGTSTVVQIDHVVALSDAWQKGAQQLDEVTRRNFANDPRNLQAVAGPANQQKSDGDAATWLPSNKAYRCTYVSRQVEVKSAYSLWVTEAERDAIARVLGECGATAPASAPATAPAVAEPTAVASNRPARPQVSPEPAQAPAPAPAPLVAPAPDPAPAPAPAPSGGVYYKNCAAARAADAAPIYAGQPGYSSKLDRDGDGVACE
ncbi:DUF1524 domain-containing protein [Rhodococcus sp. ABRD24]|uniref:GmrSD restriction endonuclease domain-containing protein n=1 Tax=Rhodococcus sp. ABRD24 TaxID=2507582 RepID=UPI00103A088F|nr:DUF1524 domain-containing protein [Rhodococcus sp. ABRD24]QBJ98615.1 DUF1524 domain-containing protein [Rhodococcus sp. ABRD24]